MRFGFQTLLPIALFATLPVLGFGSLAWTNQQVDAVAKMGDREVAASFHFKNSGATPVTIRDIRSGCECTVAELTKRTYAPGEEGSIKAVFTVGARTGRHEKVLTVTTDDPSAPTISLNLRIDIEEVLALSTRILRWQVGGAPEEQSVDLSVLGPHRIAALELKEVSPKEQARVRIVPTEPGVKYQLFILPDTLREPRTVTVNFVARFEGEGQQAFSVFALAR
jgi:hypothetical protein